mgnify:FL=1|tara:strand:+ start:629 stop:1171 length:543 start_codon:yes stop_codon:yes gene_type:complete
MKLLIEDNFLKSPDEIRNLALLMPYTCSEDMSIDVGWRGYRTEEWGNYSNKILDNISERILNKVAKFYDVEGQRILSYFHISHEGTKNTLDNFNTKKYHIDPDKSYAGVIYLNPNAPKETGTSILDGSKNQIVSVDNVYNRLFAYPGDHIHAPSDLFGDDIRNGRMTVTFFLERNWSWSS